MSKNNKSIYQKVEKSTLVWHYSNGYSKDDIRWAHTNLYKTAHGEYFLHVSGGPGSHYANVEKISTAWGDGLSYTNGEAIIPLSLNELIAWGEENLPDHILKKVLKEIRQRTKRQNKEIPKLLKITEKKLSMREKERKNRLAAAEASAKVKARLEKYYEQFVEL
jgi:hypothetical protein